MTALILPLIAGGMVFIGSTWLGDVAIWGAKPDLALLVLMVYAHRQGIQRGQIAGFAIGILLDLLGASPIGFYAVLGMITGVVAGATKDAFRTDSILAPPMLALAVMLARSIAAFILSLILGLNEMRVLLWSAAYLIEIGLNIVLAPIVFLLVDLLMRRVDRGETRF